MIPMRPPAPILDDKSPASRRPGRCCAITAADAPNTHLAPSIPQAGRHRTLDERHHIPEPPVPVTVTAPPPEPIRLFAFATKTPAFVVLGSANPVTVTVPLLPETIVLPL